MMDLPRFVATFDHVDGDSSQVFVTFNWEPTAEEKASAMWAHFRETAKGSKKPEGWRLQKIEAEAFHV